MAYWLIVSGEGIGLDGIWRSSAYTAEYCILLIDCDTAMLKLRLLCLSLRAVSPGSHTAGAGARCLRYRSNLEPAGFKVWPRLGRGGSSVVQRERPAPPRVWPAARRGTGRKVERSAAPHIGPRTGGKDVLGPDNSFSRPTDS